MPYVPIFRGESRRITAGPTTKYLAHHEWLQDDAALQTSTTASLLSKRLILSTITIAAIRYFANFVTYLSDSFGEQPVGALSTTLISAGPSLVLPLGLLLQNSYAAAQDLPASDEVNPQVLSNLTLSASSYNTSAMTTWTNDNCNTTYVIMARNDGVDAFNVTDPRALTWQGGWHDNANATYGSVTDIASQGSYIYTSTKNGNPDIGGLYGFFVGNNTSCDTVDFGDAAVISCAHYPKVVPIPAFVINGTRAYVCRSTGDMVVDNLTTPCNYCGSGPYISNKAGIPPTTINLTNNAQQILTGTTEGSYAFNIVETKVETCDDTGSVYAPNQTSPSLKSPRKFEPQSNYTLVAYDDGLAALNNNFALIGHYNVTGVAQKYPKLSLNREPNLWFICWVKLQEF